MPDPLTRPDLRDQLTRLAELATTPTATLAAAAILAIDERDALLRQVEVYERIMVHRDASSRWAVQPGYLHGEFRTREEALAWLRRQVADFAAGEGEPVPAYRYHGLNESEGGA